MLVRSAYIWVLFLTHIPFVHITFNTASTEWLRLYKLSIDSYYVCACNLCLMLILFQCSLCIFLWHKKFQCVNKDDNRLFIHAY